VARSFIARFSCYGAAFGDGGGYAATPTVNDLAAGNYTVTATFDGYMKNNAYVTRTAPLHVAEITIPGGPFGIRPAPSDRLPITATYTGMTVPDLRWDITPTSLYSARLHTTASSNDALFDLSGTDKIWVSGGLVNNSDYTIRAYCALNTNIFTTVKIRVMDFDIDSEKLVLPLDAINLLNAVGLTGNQTADWTLSAPGGDDLFQYASFVTDDPQMYGAFIPGAKTVNLFSGFTHPTNYTITARHNTYTNLIAKSELVAVKLDIDEIDNFFAPGEENMSVKYSIKPDNFTSVSAKVEIFKNTIQGDLVYKDETIPKNGKHTLSWDGKGNQGNYNGKWITPGFYAVKISAKLDANTSVWVDKTSGTSVSVHSIEIVSDKIETDGKIFMNFIAGLLDNIGFTDFHALVKLRKKDGTGVAMQVPITVHFTATEGANNTAKNDSFEYSTGNFLGKKNDAAAVYWQSNPKSVSPASADSYKTTSQSTTITTAGGDLGKSFMTLLPSGVGGDTFELKAEVRADNNSTILAATTNTVVWRKVEFSNILEMTNGSGMPNETHIRDNATKALIQPYFTGTASTFVEYEIDMSNIGTIDADKSVPHIGLWVDDPTLGYQQDWTVIQQKINLPGDPRNETPTQQQWDSAIHSNGIVQATARNDIIALAQKWVNRIDAIFITSENTWLATMPSNTLVSIKYYHPKYNSHANDWQTSEWGNYTWLTVNIPGITQPRQPDGWWRNCPENRDISRRCTLPRYRRARGSWQSRSCRASSFW